VLKNQQLASSGGVCYNMALVSLQKPLEIKE